MSHVRHCDTTLDQGKRNDSKPIQGSFVTRFKCKGSRQRKGKKIDNHTFLTAYIDVPSDCKHGTTFNGCSHSKCKSIARFCRTCCSLSCARNFNANHYPVTQCHKKTKRSAKNSCILNADIDGALGAGNCIVNSEHGAKNEDDESKDNSWVNATSGGKWRESQLSSWTPWVTGPRPRR
jgi:hypothetical protein